MLGQLLTDQDTGLAGSFILQLTGGQVEFQFPPKVTHDGRKGEWTEGQIPGTEPVASLAKPDARTFTITWVYVVDGSYWDAAQIGNQLQLLRGYWMFKDVTNLVVHVQFWAIGGPSLTTARITDVDIKYSDTIIGTGNDAFPLRTDVTIGLKLWYKVGTEGANDIIQQVNGLDMNQPNPWY